MGHTALTCYCRFDHAFQDAGPNLTSYTASPSQPRNLNWYPDTGATHHIQVGNGTRLSMKNTGISQLSPNFILHSVLHVPQITKNLLSIQKSTYDNNVYVEFSPFLFFC